MADTSKTQIRNTQTLSPASRSMRRRPAAPSQPGRRKGLNRSYVLISLVIGTLLWFGVDLKRKVDQTMDVRIEFKLAQDWKIITQSDRQVKVTVKATQQEMNAIRRDQLKIVPEFPTGALDGDTFDGTINLSASDIAGLPPGVEIVSIVPAVTTVRLSKTVTRYMPVQAGKIVGTPQEGYVIGKVRPVDPPAMPVTASKEFLSKVTATDVLRTKDFSVEGGKGLVGGLVGLEPFEKDGETITVPGMVYVTVELEELPAEREFEQPFEVRALIESPFERYARLNISPPSVKVTVAGPKTVIDKLTANEITIYADLRDRVPAAPGEFNLKCKAITPARVRVVRIEPDTVKWIVRDEPNRALEPLG